MSYPRGYRRLVDPAGIRWTNLCQEGDVREVCERAEEDKGEERGGNRKNVPVYERGKERKTVCRVGVGDSGVGWRRRGRKRERWESKEEKESKEGRERQRDLLPICFDLRAVEYKSSSQQNKEWCRRCQRLEGRAVQRCRPTSLCQRQARALSPHAGVQPLSELCMHTHLCTRTHARPPVQDGMHAASSLRDLKQLVHSRFRHLLVESGVACAVPPDGARTRHAFARETAAGSRLPNLERDGLERL
eukprot:6177369-Pleurochrysis_carterae.AAC.3